MKHICILSPLTENIEDDIAYARDYCKIASLEKVLPLSPTLIFTEFLNEKMFDEREEINKLSLALLSKCDEVWVMGTTVTEEMKNIIEFAKIKHIPIFNIERPYNTEFYPISKDNERLLSITDVEDESEKQEYTDKVVVIAQEYISSEYKVAENQLYVVTHGPGTRVDFKMSDTVHLKNLFDGEFMTVGRKDILGVVKPKVLEELHEKLNNNIQTNSLKITQENVGMELN